MVDLSSLGP